jgi:hypothetical protein
LPNLVGIPKRNWNADKSCDTVVEMWPKGPAPDNLGWRPFTLPS